MSTIHRIAPEERVEGQPPGMTREQAIQTEGMWAGFVRTGPGMVSGWHHHVSYESSIYVLSGSLRMEFGPGGAETFDAGPGDFVFVGKQLVHRGGQSLDRTRRDRGRSVRGGRTGRQRRRPRVGRLRHVGGRSYTRRVWPC